MPHETLQLDPNGTLLVESVPAVDMATSQLLPGQSQTVVVTSTQPPPYPPHPAITTLAPLEVGIPYTVSPYTFVHQHHPFPTFGAPMPPHRVALPPQPPNMQMHYHAAFSPHPGHPQHPHHAPQAQPPTVQQYYAPQPTVTTVNVHPPPGAPHMFTIQQPVPVNVSFLFK